VTEVIGESGHDRTEPVDIQVEMQRSYIDYAMSVIVGRALPDVRDGLKPVHTRILYAMFDGGYRPERGYFKCSRVIGDVMGNYHPHGDGAIYDALVRMAQPWSMRMPLVDGQGNFGSPGNDPPAAMRYTECRLAPLAMEMLRDINEETVDFRPNYDGRSAEPVVLPSRFPNLLVNGSEGIAVGMATKIPPHNLREVAAGVHWYLENFERFEVPPPGAAGAEEVTDERRREVAAELLDGLMERIPGPDFPTRGLIVGRRGIREAYRTGRGSIMMRAVVEVEEIQGRTCLVVKELPFQVNPDNLATKIAELVKDGRLSGIADVRDETSGRTGQRLVIVLKRDAIAKVVLNNLYKHTQLQDTFGVNMLALVDGVPRTLRLDQVIRYWVAHQIDVIQRRTRFRLLAARGDRRYRRGHRTDPCLGIRGRRADRPDGAAGDRRDPGAGDPRHAAAQAGRPGAAGAHGRAGRPRGEDRRLRVDPGLAVAAARDHRHRARRHRVEVRQCAPHRDHRLRRRGGRRGPDRRVRHRGDDHARRVRQADEHRSLPGAAAGRQGRPGCRVAVRRHRGSLLRHLDAPLDPVLHEQGPGLPG
jgi:DNA gyrase subunit A